MVEWIGKLRGPKHRPTPRDFKNAAKRIEKVAIHTPLLPLRRYKEEDQQILLKPEMLQPVGSYKIRGVYNWLTQLPEEQRKKGVSTLSAGNMSQGLGYAANLIGVPSRAFMHETVPKSKVESCRKYGMDVQLRNSSQLFDLLDNIPADYCFLHPFAEFILLDGHGTIGLEIMEAAPETDTIYIPLGVGFVSCGTALAAKSLNPRVRVVGVNPKISPFFYESLRRGKPVPYEHRDTVADAINDPVYEDTLKLVGEVLDDVVLVSEDEIRRAIRFLALENKVVAEGAGAVSLAAALATPIEERGRSVCVLSGGGIDSGRLAQILEEK